MLTLVGGDVSTISKKVLQLIFVPTHFGVVTYKNENSRRANNKIFFRWGARTLPRPTIETGGDTHTPTRPSP